MEENKDYHVYRYGDHLVPGAKLSIEHSVSCENVDISHLITEGTGRLSAMLQESHDNEQKAYEIVVAAAKQWEQQAVTTQLINRALEYLRTPEVAHTSNQWQPNPHNDEWEEISNRVYKMNCNIREDTAYDRSTGTRVPKAWYVTWNLYLNTAKNGYNLHIAGQDHKRYTDKAAAYKYLAGRKKAYAHLFTEISPEIPKQYEQHFMVYGVLLPGYRVEGTERTAAEQKEVSDGGISVSEGKPSVLKKLDQAKQDRPAAAPDPAAKKKEDVSL